MKSVVIVDGVRTPQGSLGGALKDLSAQKLGEIVVRALLERTKLKPELVEEVIFGCVGQQSDAPNIARVIALMSKLPVSIPAFTVQRNCASGLQAVISAYQMIALGEAEVVLAGGTESMSSAPYVNRDLRFGKKLRHSITIDSLWEGLTDPIVNQIMGETAENLVQEFNISRKDQDQFALLSHQRAFRAAREGKFKDEIVKVLVPKKVLGKNLPPEPIIQDEGPNPGLTEQVLSQYPTIFRENGSVTPGNSCPISDGASCLLLMSEEKAKALGHQPIAHIKSYGFAGVAPEKMGIGPTCAIPIALKRAGMNLKDIQLIEINEAFAAQYLACEQVLKLDRNLVNVNGGAIALGHPVGATGARLLVTLINEMKRKNLSTGLISMCVGGGQGGAMIVERK